MEKQVLQIYKKLSTELNIPLNVVIDIVDSEFRMIQVAMKEGTKGEPETFKNVILLHLGKFVAKPKRIKWLQQLSEKKRKRKQTEIKDEDNGKQSVAGTSSSSN